MKEVVSYSQMSFYPLYMNKKSRNFILEQEEITSGSMSRNDCIYISYLSVFRYSTTLPLSDYRTTSFCFLKLPLSSYCPFTSISSWSTRLRRTNSQTSTDVERKDTTHWVPFLLMISKRHSSFVFVLIGRSLKTLSWSVSRDWTVIVSLTLVN